MFIYTINEESTKMKTDIKTLLEFAGVDTTQGKAKELVEATFIMAKDLSKKTNKELAASLGSNEMNLRKATDPDKKKALAKKIAHTKSEIESRTKRGGYKKSDSTD